LQRDAIQIHVTEDRVIAVAAGYDVIACATLCQVVACASTHFITAREALQMIVTGRIGHRLMRRISKAVVIEPGA
jgi:hypothetical protein